MHRLAGDAPHNVDAEFEAHFMNAVRKRLEPFASGRGRKPVGRRDQPGISVHFQGDKRAVSGGMGARLIPLDVHHHILPTEGLQMLRHVAGIAQNLLLGHACAVAIPAVPAHGRSCRILLVCRLMNACSGHVIQLLFFRIIRACLKTRLRASFTYL
ncbi:hypothetical protein D3C75_1045770 [compost metagenome]